MTVSIERKDKSGRLSLIVLKSASDNSEVCETHQFQRVAILTVFSWVLHTQKYFETTKISSKHQKLVEAVKSWKIFRPASDTGGRRLSLLVRLVGFVKGIQQLGLAAKETRRWWEKSCHNFLYAAACLILARTMVHATGHSHPFT